VMLFTQPTVQVNALYRAYLYGIMYLVWVVSFVAPACSNLRTEIQFVDLPNGMEAIIPYVR
jgi:hypothetical protein